MADVASFLTAHPGVPWPNPPQGMYEPFVSWSEERVGDDVLFRFVTASGAGADATWSGTEWQWLTTESG